MQPRIVSMFAHLSSKPTRIRREDRRPSQPTIPTKLKVGAVNDPAEREADRVAESVVAGLHADNIATGSSPVVRRQCDACAAVEDDEVQRVAEPGARVTSAPTNARRLIDRARPTAKPLAADLRASLEPQFGTNFGDVRVQTGPEGHAASRALGARAFTLGSDVFFAQGQYQPNTIAGRKLLAHELTHVVQQRGASGIGLVQRAPGASSECEASLDPAEWFANQQLTQIRLAPVDQNLALLATGASGEAVELLQQALMKWGCARGMDVLPVHGSDGIYGAETRAAVRSVQRANLLDADGIVGPNTMSVLDQVVVPDVPDGDQHDDHNSSDGSKDGEDTPANEDDKKEELDPDHKCGSKVWGTIEGATARIIKARARLESFVASGKPDDVGPKFERAFGRTDADNMRDVIAFLTKAERILDEARPGILDRAETSWRVRCFHDGEHPDCQSDKKINAFADGATKTIGICMDKRGSEDLKVGDIIHESMHVALPSGHVDIYGHLRLFDLLTSESSVADDSVAMYNPDNYRYFVMMIDGVTGPDARNDDNTPADHYHFNSDTRRAQAERALAFAEAWAYRGVSTLENLLSTFGGWRADETWSAYRWAQKVILMLRNSNAIARGGPPPRSKIDDAACTGRYGNPDRLAELDCPLDTGSPTGGTTGTVIRILDLIDGKFDRKLHSRAVTMTEAMTNPEGPPYATWLLRSTRPHLILAPNFFIGRTLQEQVKAILLALARAQGQSKRPDDAKHAIDFMSDNFHALYSGFMKNA